MTKKFSGAFWRVLSAIASAMNASFQNPPTVQAQKDLFSSRKDASQADCGCVEDQPQRMAVRKPAGLRDVLRLVAATQPQSVKTPYASAPAFFL